MVRLNKTQIKQSKEGSFNTTSSHALDAQTAHKTFAYCPVPSSISIPRYRYAIHGKNTKKVAGDLRKSKIVKFAQLQNCKYYFCK